MRKIFLLISICLLQIFCAACVLSVPASKDSSNVSQASDACSTSSSQTEQLLPGLSSSVPSKTQREMEDDRLSEHFPEDFTSDFNVAELEPDLGKATSIQIVGSAVQNVDMIPVFEGDLFHAGEHWYAYSEDSIFFLATPYSLVSMHHNTSHALFYYQAEEKPVKVLDRVLEISGVDKNGLFLVRATGESSLQKLSELESNALVYFEPETGRETSLVDRVCFAHVASDSPFVYYVRAVSRPLDSLDVANHDFLLTLRRWNRNSGEDILLWSDDGILINSTDPFPAYAFDGNFSTVNGELTLTLHYPSGSEFPAWRTFELKPQTGAFLSEENPYHLYFETMQKELQEKQKNTPIQSEISMDSYTIWQEKSPSHQLEELANYFLSVDGEKKYLGTGRTYNTTQYNDYLFFGNNENLWLYAGGQQLYHLKGYWSTFYALFWEDKIYLQNGHNSLYRLSKADGNVLLELLYKVEIFPPDTEEDFYWKRPYLIGNFILDDTTDSGCFILQHIPSGDLQVMNGDGMVIRVGG